MSIEYTPIVIPMTISSNREAIPMAIADQTEYIEMGVTEKYNVVDAPTYDGEYIVTPKAYDAIFLPTTGKLMEQDVMVLKVPRYDTSNLAGGETVYIAEV